MISLKFFIAVIVTTISITIIQWFFVGFVFHKYQAETPAVWRKESSRSYAGSTLLALVFAFMFMVIFSIWKNKYGDMSMADGIKFGALCWITFAVPLEIGSAIYVNYSRMFVIGKTLSSLVEYIIAGVLATALL